MGPFKKKKRTKKIGVNSKNERPSFSNQDSKEKDGNIKSAAVQNKRISTELMVS